MKKILKVVSLITACIVLVSCGSSSENETAQSPKTIMETFEGDRRIWYLVQENTSYGATCEPSYDSVISAVYVIEDKKVTEAYYLLRKLINNEVWNSLDLGDMNGLSDDEILELVRREYKNVTKNYTYSEKLYDERFYSGDNYMSAALSLPYEIHYYGERDNSGNAYERETIYLLPSSSESYYKEQQDSESNDIRYIKKGIYVDTSFNCKDIIQSTQILDKKYVGYGDYDKCFLTLDTYESFDVKFDDPNGEGEFRFG